MTDQQRVWADYTTVGHATTFTVVLSERQRAGLEVGDTVVVEGDDVPDQLAMVTAVDGRLVTVALATRPYPLPGTCPNVC